MSNALQDTIANGADAAAGIPEIDAQIEADEAAWKAQGRAGLDEGNTPRDDKGRFASADEAERAGQATEQEGNDDAKGSGDNEQSENPAETSGDAAKATQKPADKPKAATVPGNRGADGSDVGNTNGKPQSAYTKEQERKAKSWEAINSTKKEIEAQREQLKLERESFEAQQKTATATVRDAKGFSAQDYERAGQQYAQQAQTLTAQALEAETSGNFAEVDRLQAQASQKQELAKAAEQRAQGLRGNAGGSTWVKLGADLPEALQFGSTVNNELRQLLRSKPDLLGDPMGPYRAAVQIGRSVLQKTEAELAKHKAEAAKVPELQKQIESLSSRVEELTRLTSLPGGGGAAQSRGGGEKRFADLSIEEMEAQLNAENAA